MKSISEMKSRFKEKMEKSSDYTELHIGEDADKGVPEEKVRKYEKSYKSKVIKSVRYAINKVLEDIPTDSDGDKKIIVRINYYGISEEHAKNSGYFMGYSRPKYSTDIILVEYGDKFVERNKCRIGLQMTSLIYECLLSLMNRYSVKYIKLKKDW